MAGVAALPTLYSSICRSLGIPNASSSTSIPSFPFLCFPLRRNDVAASRSCQYSTTKRKNFHGIITTRIRAVEEETLIPESEETSSVSDLPVSVPVSPSDMLTMFFQAEGTMNESDVPKVINALEQIEGVSDLQVRIVESIASVELTKQTTVQATGVASNLVEIIQGSGFKLQTLNLSFKDEEDNID
ncbi:Heavy metal-associated domain [Macleaya cordata]|uniref:Heavy metal-associated domain n=1 Tax=Macleaya cordata TaxID=56857 RepID=A0A200QL90_MACCD|nr:Heavy metal-associated domain [Macleaya cordata]